MLNRTLELGRMRSFNEYTSFIILKLLLKASVCHSSMRVEQISHIVICLLYCLCNLFVGIAATANVAANCIVRIAVKVENASKVARISYIHSIGNCRNRLARLVAACKQILEENIVTIVCRNETLDWQSHCLANQRSTNIAEISTWHSHYNVVERLFALCELGIGKEIVEHLGQEAGHIY